MDVKLVPIVAARDSRFFTTGDFYEVAPGPWLMGYTHFIHARYFKEKMDNLDTLFEKFEQLLTTLLLSVLQPGHDAVSPCLHRRPTFGPSCTEFVYPGCWHFDNDATSKFDDVLLEHGGLPTTPCPSSCCPAGFVFGGQVQGTILRCSYSLSIVVVPLLHA